jgi:hypothetical protein
VICGVEHACRRRSHRQGFFEAHAELLEVGQALAGSHSSSSLIEAVRAYHKGHASALSLAALRLTCGGRFVDVECRRSGAEVLVAFGFDA